MTPDEQIEKWADDLQRRLTIRVPSVQDAIRVAELAKKRMVFDLFRGHANSEWRLTSTAERLGEAGWNEVKEKIGRFVGWAKLKDSAMAPYVDNMDGLWAIAQHYGLPTRFIDFTPNPSVAAFFASDIKSDSQPPGEAAIVCLSSQDFADFWKLKIWDDRGLLPENRPELITIDVVNLWRLQAQEGCFMWSAINDIERFYWSLGKIVYPFTRYDPAIPRREVIYPLNQSALEISLQQFFQNELLVKFHAEMDMDTNPNVITVEAGPDAYELRSWWNGDFSVDPEWMTADEWNQVKVEPFHEVHPGLLINCDSILSFEELADSISAQFTTELIHEKRNCGLVVVGLELLVKDSPSRRLTSCVTRLWNGMRILPYTVSEIELAMSLCVGHFKDRIKFGAKNNPFQDEEIYVDMAASSDGDGAYARAYVSENGLLDAASPDFLDAVREHTNASETELAWAMIQMGARPWERFTFSGLRKLMVTEIIPTQVAWRGDLEGDDGLGRPLIFSPKGFKVFGLA